MVIGVHAPEFAFEKNIDNVRWAVKDMRVDYPVAVDNDHVIWRAFRNQYWPALYFIDAQGRVRHHHFGEGSYEQSEMVIQELLAEAGAGVISREPVSVEARGIEAAADWGNLKSPENYVGYARTQNFASPGGAVSDQPRMYELPARLRLNDWALSGDWTVRKDATALNKPNGRIAYRFHARDLHLVMGPAAPGTSVRFRVLIDGQPPGAAHGIDVDEQGIRHGYRTATVSADPATEAHRRSTVRDRVSSIQAWRRSRSHSAEPWIRPRFLCVIRTVEPENRMQDWFTALRRASCSGSNDHRQGEARCPTNLSSPTRRGFLGTSAVGAVTIAAAQLAAIGSADAQSSRTKRADLAQDQARDEHIVRVR